MSSGRLEAFSDAVIAIVITVMVLELGVPHGTDFDAIRPVLPLFLAYVLSFASLPVAAYGAISLCAAVAYYVLQRSIIRSQGADSVLAAALGRDLKGKISPGLYLAGAALAHPVRWVSLALYIVVALV